MSSLYSLTQTQREVYFKYSTTPIRNEHYYASQASQSSSAPADPARKREHQNAHTEISSDTYHSTNTDDNHNACDISDEDPRLAKKRKPRLALAVILATSRGYTLELHIGQPRFFVALSIATPKINDAQL
ncbi:uncharacterized protein LY89DRAFT_375218 [Mollisia scopiformis]|uniref:Uncharacterized protein n=1 Tax=Mollisia scopiformis TaxID=149040 RepID=A0A132B5S2_MOLSC|nr:uncharacterized protein LY89DRAFT_375218 [Mollisia scopiformis]KUJ07017.1 hypothetical protein LY89DRAFT_375218 [Mollisia scopiformis]